MLYIFQDDQWTVHAADGVVPNSWLDPHHARIYALDHFGECAMEERRRRKNVDDDGPASRLADEGE